MARKKPDPRVAVAYLRLSKDEGEQRTSFPVQRAAIEEWAARKGMRVAAWHQEEVSTREPLSARREFWEAMADLEGHGAGVLVVSTMLRLCRDPGHYERIADELRARRAVLATADGKGEGTSTDANFIRGLELLLGQRERDQIRDRVVGALANKRARGERTGGIPYGYQLAPGGVLLEECPPEQAVLAAIRALAAAGKRAPTIARELARRGVVGRPLPPGTPGKDGSPPRRPGGGPARPLTRGQVHDLMLRMGVGPDKPNPVPYGQRLGPGGVGLEDDPGEQAVLAQIRELAARGWRAPTIAHELERRGVTRRPDSGGPGPFARGQVYNLMLRMGLGPGKESEG